MAVIPTPEQGKKILDFSDGTFDGNSYLLQSRNGATEFVDGDDVADYVNTSRIYDGLNTTSKTPVGAINEINRKEASDIPFDNTESGMTATDVQSAIDEINNTAAPLFYLGTYTYSVASVAANRSITISKNNFGITDIDGYTPISMPRIGVSKAGFVLTTFNATGVNTVLGVMNNTSDAIENTTFTIGIIFVKSNFLKELT